MKITRRNMSKLLNPKDVAGAIIKLTREGRSYVSWEIFSLLGYELPKDRWTVIRLLAEFGEWLWKHMPEIMEHIRAEAPEIYERYYKHFPSKPALIIGYDRHNVPIIHLI